MSLLLIICQWTLLLFFTNATFVFVSLKFAFSLYSSVFCSVHSGIVLSICVVQSLTRMCTCSMICYCISPYFSLVYLFALFPFFAAVLSFSPFLTHHLKMHVCLVAEGC